MKDMPSVKEVKELYIKSVMELAEFDPKIVNSLGMQVSDSGVLE